MIATMFQELWRFVPQGQHFINRRLQPTDNLHFLAAKSRRDDTFASVALAGLGGYEILPMP
ncbi:hypothetical protein FACS189452_05850 [Bacteroidia bacterium]|nr:hypothetical protein AGMMS4956_09770 [Bacteroidia bacterium]GHT67674.1 hypothetical protein FACS189452_05850 [Bacteroidia bacterium]